LSEEVEFSNGNAGKAPESGGYFEILRNYGKELRSLAEKVW
jgi:hypothetical protein